MTHHALANLLGWAAILVTLWATVAQFLRAVLRGIEGISLATWTLFALMGVFWITYGASQRSPIIILGSLLVLPLQVVIVARLRPWSAPMTLLRSGAYALVFCVLPTVFWGWSGGVYGTGVAMVINRMPQLTELVRQRNATGVSVAMWAMGATGSALWVAYYALSRNWAPLVSTAAAGAVSVVIALLTYWRHVTWRARIESDDVVVASLLGVTGEVEHR